MHHLIKTSRFTADP